MDDGNVVAEGTSFFAQFWIPWSLL